MKVMILICMIFCHIVDDYYFQGILASMKQKSWWQENAPDEMYQYDYIIALIMHSISWSFMTLLPVCVFYFASGKFHGNTVTGYITFFAVSTIIHAVIDHFKANRRAINLIQDQSFHMVQIFIIWLLMIYI